MQLVNYLRMADKDTFRHVVATLHPEGELCRTVRHLGIECTCMNKKSVLGPLASFRLWKWLLKKKADIVHFQGSYMARRGRVVMLVARPRKLICSTEHDLGFWKKRWEIRLDRLLSERTDALISVSSASYKIRRQRERYPAERAVLIHNGVDVGRFEREREHRDDVRRELGVDEDTFLIAFVGRLETVKNVPFFIRVLGEIGNLPSIETSGVIVGDGSRRAQLEAYSSALMVRKKISFLGMRSDVPRLLAGMDVYLHTSTQEDCSISILEAMAAGLPVVATDSGGNSDLIVHGKTGYLCQHGDIASHVRYLRNLLQDPRLLREMGEAARSRVRKDFSLENQARQLQGLYLGLIEKSRERK